MPPARRPSLTARKIAQFVPLLQSIPRFAGLLPHGLADTTEAILRASGTLDPLEARYLGHPFAQKVLTVVEGVTKRGQVLWFGVRKRWMHDVVEAAIADGARQLLVVGAGFDALATVVAERHPDVLCIEIDAPPTASPKEKGVRGAGKLRPNLLLCPIDLSRKPLADALRSTTWNPAARSIVVAEGLLMYLSREHVVRFFEDVRRSSGAGTRVAFSSVFAKANGAPRIGALDFPLQLGLRVMGETMRWGLAPKEAPAFLASVHARVVEQATEASLRERYLTPIGLGTEPLAPYEHLVLAELERVSPAAVDDGAPIPEL